MPQEAALRGLGVDVDPSQFALGSSIGLAYEPTARALRFASSGGCDGSQDACATLAPDWTPAYANITSYSSFNTLTGALGVPYGALVPVDLGIGLQNTTAFVAGAPGQIGKGLELSQPGALTFLSDPLTPHFSFIAWINSRLIFSGSLASPVFEFGIDSNQYMYLHIDPTGVQFRISTTGAAGAQALDYGNSAALYTKLTHLALTLDGTTGSLYLDGEQVASAPINISPTSIAGATRQLMARSLTGSYAAVGTYDELALFNTALNAAQVRVIYDRQLPYRSSTFRSRVMGPLPTPPWSRLSWQIPLPAGEPLPAAGQSEATADYISIPPNLMAANALLWHLDDTGLGGAPGGLDLVDASGSGQHGRVNAPLLLAKPGRLGTSIRLDGSASNAATTVAQPAPAAFSVQAWLRTVSTSGGEIAGFGDASSGLSNVVDRVLYMDNGGSIHFGVTGSFISVVRTQTFYNDGLWHHVLGTVDASGKQQLYVDGALAVPATLVDTLQPFPGYWRLGGDRLDGWPGRPASNFLVADLDEFAIWNRDLSASEAAAVWRRGATRSRWRIRACTSPTCADLPAWIGPDGTPFTYFSEANNAANPALANGAVKLGPPSMLFADFSPSLALPANPYFQYELTLESDDRLNSCTSWGNPAPCGPDIQRVQADLTTYQAAASLTSQPTLHTFYNLNGVGLTPGPSGCAQPLSHALSLNGSQWWWYSSGQWQAADGTFGQSNADGSLSPAAFNQFAPQVGTGPITVRVFLTSPSPQTAPCSLANVHISGNG